MMNKRTKALGISCGTPFRTAKKWCPPPSPWVKQQKHLLLGWSTSTWTKERGRYPATADTQEAQTNNSSAVYPAPLSSANGLQAQKAKQQPQIEDFRLTGWPSDQEPQEKQHQHQESPKSYVGPIRSFNSYIFCSCAAIMNGITLCCYIFIIYCW